MEYNNINNKKDLFNEKYFIYVNKKLYVIYYNIIRKIFLLLFLIVNALFYALDISNKTRLNYSILNKTLDCLAIIVIIIDIIVSSYITKLVRKYISNICIYYTTF